MQKINKIDSKAIESTYFSQKGIWNTIAGIAQVYLLGYNLLRPDREMSSVIGDIAQSFPQLLNSINTIQNNISSIRVAIENIDEEIRGVFNEQLALEALGRARTKAEQVKSLMKDTTSLKVNADSILEKSMEIEEEINVFLQRTQTKDGDVVGLYLTAPLISIYGKAYTYSSRQKYINLNEDPALAPNAFDSELTKKIVKFSENLVTEYSVIEAKYKPYKGVPLPIDKEYAYSFNPAAGLIKTNIKQWGAWQCMEQHGYGTPQWRKCFLDGLDGHQGIQWNNLYAIYAYIANGKPHPFMGMTTNYQEATLNGRLAKGWTFQTMSGHQASTPPHQWEVYKHMIHLVEAKEFYEMKSGKFFSDVEKFNAIVETMKSGTWEVLQLADTYYRASCQNHDWEGPRQHSYVDAQMDLDAHIEYFPDESHDGARIIRTDNYLNE